MYFDRDIQSMRSIGAKDALNVMRVTIRDLTKKFRDLEYPFLKPEYQVRPQQIPSYQTPAHASEESPYSAQYYSPNTSYKDDDNDAPRQHQPLRP
ncbi:hypothetical protein Ptr902_07004 [Pyrenophora tritici-repentis]|nr:hypothetical protein Ptr902_07004 [Pyrenophora tritici-repentis]